MTRRSRVGVLLAGMIALSSAALVWAQEPEPATDPDMLYALAESSAATAQYEESARLFEQFAAQQPNDVRAGDALHNAYLFRVGLDQRDAAKRDLVAHQRLYEAADPEQAAAIFWSQRDLLDSTKDRRKHALEYLATHDFDGGIDRVIVAEAVIGQIDWRKSCRQPLLFDSCMAIEREPPPTKPSKPSKRARRPERCGLPTQGIVTVYRRDAKLAASAQERFAKILKLARTRKRPHDGVTEIDRQHEHDFVDAWAMAMVYRADAQYEELAKLDVPEDLDFFVGPDPKWGDDPVAWRRYKAQVETMEGSTKRLRAFLEQKTDLALDLESHYVVVKETGSPYWVLAAAARVAAIRQNFADQLHRAKLPARVRGDEPIKAYCTKLADYAQPIEDHAMNAWVYCVERSTEYQFFTEFSRLCEAEVEARDPKRYPATHELFGESVYAGTGIASAPVLPEPPHEERVD